VWLTLVGISLPIALGGVVLVRAATVAFRRIVPLPADRHVWLTALALWALTSTVVLGALGTVLSAVTHHRGLGATTFAFAGLGATAVCGLVAVRLASLLRGLVRRAAVARGVLVLAGFMLINAVMLAGWLVNPQPSEGAIFAVVDAAAFVAMMALGSLVRIPSRGMRYTVPAAALAVVALVGLGVTLLPRVVSAAPAVRGSVLLIAPALDLIAKPDTKPKKRPIRIRAAASTVAPASPAASAEPASEAKFDVILVTLDTVRADHLGTYGYKRKTSPNLDAFARDAAVFERAYAAGPETRTALAPLVTGKPLVGSLRDTREWPTLLSANETLAERLRAAGYATGAVSSFQWVSNERGFAQGFDVFDEAPFRRVHPEREVTGAHAVAQAIAAHDKLASGDKPVFLWVHLFDAHEQYRGHDEFRFGAEHVDLYDSEIAYVDRELQRLLAHVQASARMSRTAWILHGSHGEAFGEHGFRGHPPKMYEEVIRVPLIVRLPGATGRRIETPPVSVLDVVPTILDLAGLAPGDSAGRSLRSLAQGTSATIPARDGVVVAFAGVVGKPEGYAWIEGGMKLTLLLRPGGERTSLFDLRTDPAEKTDLRAERPEEETRLRRALDAFLKDKLAPVEPAAL
jgi:arylsulfatase A-like enzyme